MRAISSLLVGALAFVGTASVAPTASAAPSAIGDIAILGLPSSTFGYRTHLAGPIASAPTTTVDAVAKTVTVRISDSAIGATGSLTLNWPARPGRFELSTVNGVPPEQKVTYTRETDSCAVSSGILTVHRAEATATGGVAALSADLGWAQ